MAAVALIAAGVLALLVAVLFAALVEMYRDLQQIRDALGILDRPVDIDIAELAGTKPSTYGLPRALDSAAPALVLFLSERCATCHAIAAGLPRPIPPRLWVVLETRSASSAAALLEKYGLREAAAEGQVIVDADGAIADRIGLRVTPSGFRIEGGVFQFATSVPSTRYLQSILPETFRLRAAG